jgi:hypothetical protein
MKILDTHGSKIFSNWEQIRNKIYKVDIYDLARWFYEDNTKEYYDYQKDFPCVVCPWPLAWFEFKTPKVSNNEGQLVTINKYDIYSGVLVETLEIPEDQRDRIPHEIDPALKLFPPATSIESVVHVKLPRTPRWVSRIDAFFVDKESDTVFHVSTIVDYLDTTGKLMPEIRRVCAGDSLARMFPDTVNQKDLVTDSVRVVHPVLFALSLCHCKGEVSFKEVKVPEKVAKKRVKAGKPPGETYSTLIIKSFQDRMRGNKAEGESSMDRAFHFVRAHFHTYTPEHPAFGKLVGSFFIPFHTRGKLEKGVRSHGYKIE